MRRVPLCYQIGNSLNPKTLLAPRSGKEVWCDHAEGLRASFSLKPEGTSTPSLSLLCFLFSAENLCSLLCQISSRPFALHPHLHPTPKFHPVLKNTQYWGSSFSFSSHPIFLTSFPWHFFKCLSVERERWREARDGPREFSGPTESCCCSVSKSATPLRAALSEPARNGGPLFRLALEKESGHRQLTTPPQAPEL